MRGRIKDTVLYGALVGTTFFISKGPRVIPDIYITINIKVYLMSHNSYGPASTQRHNRV